MQCASLKFSGNSRRRHRGAVSLREAPLERVTDVPRSQDSVTLNITVASTRENFRKRRRTVDRRERKNKRMQARWKPGNYYTATVFFFHVKFACQFWRKKESGVSSLFFYFTLLVLHSYPPLFSSCNYFRFSFDILRDSSGIALIFATTFSCISISSRRGCIILFSSRRTGNARVKINLVNARTFTSRREKSNIEWKMKNCKDLQSVQKGNCALQREQGPNRCLAHQANWTIILKLKPRDSPLSYHGVSISRDLDARSHCTKLQFVAASRRSARASSFWAPLPVDGPSCFVSVIQN